MGGLGPGIGGAEYIVIAIVALLVVGPERLPAMLRKLGQWVAKARNMANEFRASFDEMARQSELDELRKEVDALRRGQSNMMPLGAEAEATFRSISDDLNKPVGGPAPIAALETPEEWPDAAPVVEPVETALKPKAKRKAPASRAETASKPAAKKAGAKPKTTRRKAVDL